MATTSVMDDTELEAIELIKSQVLQIKNLKEELSHKDEAIDNFKIQLKQIDVYKNQISNLKHQISLFEERFKYFEEEREEKEKIILDQSRGGEIQTKEMLAEMNKLNDHVGQYRRQLEDDQIQMRAMQQTIEQKERMYIHIKD